MFRWLIASIVALVLLSERAAGQMSSVSLEFDATEEVLPTIHIGCPGGCLPSGLPLQIYLGFALEGNAQLVMPGEAELTWTPGSGIGGLQAAGLLSQGAWDINLGGRLVASATIDVFGIVCEFSLLNEGRDLSGSESFSPYLLPGNSERPAIAQIVQPVDFFIGRQITICNLTLGLGGILTVDPDVRIDVRGDRIRFGSRIYNHEGQILTVSPLNGSSFVSNVTWEGRVMAGGSVTLCADICVLVPFVGDLCVTDFVEDICFGPYGLPSIPVGDISGSTFIDVPLPNLNGEQLGSWSFGETPSHSCGSSHTWTVRNNGYQQLSGSLAIKGPDASQFSCVLGCAALDPSHMDYRTVQVRFCPDSTGPKNARLQITSNDPDESPHDIQLWGTGAPVCGDGSCNGSETCNSCSEDCGTCPDCTVSSECNDGNPCTDDSCVSDVCQYSDNTDACNDEHLCTSGDRCSNGSCSGTAINCNDNNPCTSDSCNPSSGCVNTPNANSCNDDDPCTANDRCSNGSCTGTPECVINSDCDDELFCNGQETCVDGCCQVGDPPCDDCDKEMDECPPGPEALYHPADQSQVWDNDCSCATCGDMRIEICEAIGYAGAWKRGDHDNLATAMRGLFLWMQGECYRWDDAEQNWMLTTCP